MRFGDRIAVAVKFTNKGQMLIRTLKQSWKDSKSRQTFHITFLNQSITSNLDLAVGLVPEKEYLVSLYPTLPLALLCNPI